MVEMLKSMLVITTADKYQLLCTNYVSGLLNEYFNIKNKQKR